MNLRREYADGNLLTEPCGFLPSKLVELHQGYPEPAPHVLVIMRTLPIVPMGRVP